MAQTTTSAPQQGVNMPAVDLRQMIGALVAVEGVRTSTDLLVSQRGAGANMSVDVAPGSCVITDDHASGGGVYSYTLGSTTNVAIGTANATNPRIDRVVVTVLDNALGDASNSATVSVLAGTATSGATLTNLSGAASVPSSSLLLANVLVPALASSIVTANIARAVSVAQPVGSTTLATWASLVDIANTTTESDLVGTQGSGWTIGGSTVGATGEIVIDLEGDITTASATTPTTRFKLYLGGVAVIDTGAASIVNGTGTPHPFRAEIVIAMRNATNSYFARWSTVFGNTAAANNLTAGWGTYGVLSAGSNGGQTEWTTAGDVSLDMTANQALRATLTWGTASASNELRIRQAKATLR